MLQNVVECTLYHTQETEFGRKLESFVEQLRRANPGKVRITGGSDDLDLPARPCFSIKNSWGAKIFYAALPEGHQHAPFVKALEWIAGDAPSAPPVHTQAVSPAEIEVLISDQCPHCPKVVEAVVLLVGHYPSISPCIVDVGQYPDIGEKYGIKAVPATIMDKKLVLIGNVTVDRLTELVESRGTSKFDMEVVLALIEAQKIAEAAGYLVHDAGRKVILKLVQEPDFSKRLSALVVLEKALDDNPDAVRKMAPSFAALLSNPDARIRGDIADLLGKIGDPQVIAQLEPLKADPDPDVAEIAAEAIEELRKH